MSTKETWTERGWVVRTGDGWWIEYTGDRDLAFLIYSERQHLSEATVFDLPGAKRACLGYGDKKAHPVAVRVTTTIQTIPGNRDEQK